MSGSPLRLVTFILLAFLGFSLLGFGVLHGNAAQKPQASKEKSIDFAISCTPERPTVFPRETIRATVWGPETTSPMQYTWSATGGRITGQGSEASWDFAGVPPGSYTATVEVKDPSDQSRTCSLQVIVVDHEQVRGLPRLTGRSFLAQDMKEAEGYGLYSYLLFANPPDESSRERYIKAIEAYLSLMPDVLSLEKYLKLNELNITYVPVDAEPPKSISAEWVLQHYDYARALVLLRALPGSHKDGPYIVSSLSPLTGKENLDGGHLFQDLSSVPPHLISAWVKLFLNQASQEHFWEQKSAAYFALKLRTGIGVLAIGLPDVQSSLKSWVSWK